MAETFKKIRTDNGKIILEGVQTFEIGKNQMLERLNRKLEDINDEIDSITERKTKIEAQIAQITKII